MRALEEIESGASAASPGPWECDPFEYRADGSRMYFPSLRVKPKPGDAPWVGRIVINEAEPQTIEACDATAMFIMNARTDVPDLCAEVRRLRALLKEAWDDHIDWRAAGAIGGKLVPGDFADRVHRALRGEL